MKTTFKSPAGAAGATRKFAFYAFAGIAALLASGLAAEAQVSDKVVQSLGAAPTIATSYGQLDFKDGVPTAETAQKAYDILDFTQALERLQQQLPRRLGPGHRQGLRGHRRRSPATSSSSPS